MAKSSIENSQMKRHLSKILLLVFYFNIQAIYSQGFEKDIKNFQEKLNEDFLNPEDSPLSKKQRRKFKGHDFFPANEKYRVEAKFVQTPNSVPFKMKTTTSRLPVYEKFGEAHFEINGEKYVLSIYQSHRLRDTKEYKDYLFLPFSDETNGLETYGGGRFIDLEIPKTESITIDFNKAYNPSCAYNYTYSCPIPPKENHLDVKILAGVKNYEE